MMIRILLTFSAVLACTLPSLVASADDWPQSSVRSSLDYLYDSIQDLESSTADDTAYGPTWDSNTDSATKNSIYDKLETLGGTDDTSYGVSWDASLDAATKNSLYDRLELYALQSETIDTTSSTHALDGNLVLSGDGPLFNVTSIMHPYNMGATMNAIFMPLDLSYTSYADITAGVNGGVLRLDYRVDGVGTNGVVITAHTDGTTTIETAGGEDLHIIGTTVLDAIEGYGADVAYDGSGNSGILSTDIDTIQELNDAVDGLVLSGTPADASVTTKGIVELATAAEVETGTDSSRAVTPDTLTNPTAKINQTAIFSVSNELILSADDGMHQVHNAIEDILLIMPNEECIIELRINDLDTPYVLDFPASNFTMATTTSGLTEANAWTFRVYEVSLGVFHTVCYANDITIVP